MLEWPWDAKPRAWPEQQGSNATRKGVWSARLDQHPEVSTVVDNHSDART